MRVERSIRRELEDDEFGDLLHVAVMAENWARGLIMPLGAARRADA